MAPLRVASVAQGANDASAMPEDDNINDNINEEANGGDQHVPLQRRLANLAPMRSAVKRSEQPHERLLWRDWPLMAEIVERLQQKAK